MVEGLAAPTDELVPVVPVEGKRGGPRAWAEYALTRAAVETLAALPSGLQRRAIDLLARAGRAFVVDSSRSARVFLRQAFGPDLAGDELERRVLDAWRYLLRAGIDVTVGWRHDARDPLERFETRVCADAERAARGGCVVVSPHLGPWEAATPAFRALGFGPAYAISKPPRNRPLSRYLQRVRARRGIRLLPRQGAMKTAPQVVERGGVLFMMLDQRARKRPVLAPFFGRPAWCERTAGVLIRRLRAPLVFYACTFAERPWHYRLEIPAVLWPEELAGLEPAEVATRINREMERMILAHPDQYLWLHDRYAKAPPAPG